MSVLVAISLGSLAASPTGLVSKHNAIELVSKAVQHACPNEALRCFSFETDEQSDKAFEIAVRENHQHGCGGDPDVTPVRDRFRVDRARVRLWLYDPVDDQYRPCEIGGDQKPVCPKSTH
jgi:hypothetical protein